MLETSMIVVFDELPNGFYNKLIVKLNTSQDNDLVAL